MGKELLKTFQLFVGGIEFVYKKEIDKIEFGNL